MFTVIMYYIYTLSLKEIPFYVGLTTDPLSRYKAHYSGPGCGPYGLVRYHFRTFGVLAQMKIVYCCECGLEAAIMERLAIIGLFNAKFSIVNGPKSYYYPTDIDYFPVYDIIDARLPHRWLPTVVKKDIINQKERIAKEYEQSK